MSKLGEALKRLRSSKLMSLREVADKSGIEEGGKIVKVHVSTLSKIESGDTTKVRFSTVKHLAKAFEMEPAELAKVLGVIDDDGIAHAVPSSHSTGGTHGKGSEVYGTGVQQDVQGPSGTGGSHEDRPRREAPEREEAESEEGSQKAQEDSQEESDQKEGDQEGI